ncbi:lytic transglycosylase domain-containing protein [Hyalangium minutum]|uniref:Soluble lytic murein transglycosylase n=1 Tax=Hyalangium minutum TaxID=394096 RepID=A0A085WI84_9BACT|nr:transglycosylase SLT domain-containing protein [Hyalangium minutum]KFE67310.1 Soluble lytic murein transglycosylase [Hyalangium minutum]KFE67397.1 Soluble lytic murein transglycosylase [Hyalangium minutum]
MTSPIASRDFAVRLPVQDVPAPRVGSAQTASQPVAPAESGSKRAVALDLQKDGFSAGPPTGAKWTQFLQGLQGLDAGKQQEQIIQAHQQMVQAQVQEQLQQLQQMIQQQQQMSQGAAGAPPSAGGVQPAGGSSAAPAAPAVPQAPAGNGGIVPSTGQAPGKPSASAPTGSGPVSASGDAKLGSGFPSALGQFKGAIESAAAKAGVPASMLAGQIWQESRGNIAAVTTNGGNGLTDTGLMQVNPNTFGELQAKHPELQGKNLADPETNILAGAFYMKDMKEQFGSWDLALRAYNSGPNGVDKSNPNAIPAGTGDATYVNKVKQFWDTIQTGKGSLPA